MCFVHIVTWGEHITADTLRIAWFHNSLDCLVRQVLKEW